MRRRVLHALSAILIAAVAIAAGTPGPQTIQVRQDNFKAMGRAMKAVSDELRKPSPDLAIIRANAGGLAAASQRVRGHFPAGSGPEAGVRTDALPAIWQRPAEFNASANRLTAATRSLESILRQNSIPAIQAAVGAVGQSCKSCHDNFRKPRS